MYPILFSLGKIHFYSYGFFASLALIASYLVIYQLSKKAKILASDLLEKSLMVFLASLIFGRLSYFFLYQEQFSHWWQIFFLWQGGLISFGAIFGGLITYIYLFKRNLLIHLDILALAFLLGVFFWRIGCFLTNDHPTVARSVWYAIENRVPAILFESLGGLGGFVFASFIYKKKIFSPGLIFAGTVIYYGLLRLLVDQWRLDPLIGPLTTGQLAGLIMMIIGILAMIGMIVYSRNRRFYKVGLRDIFSGDITSRS